MMRDRKLEALRTVIAANGSAEAIDQALLPLVSRTDVIAPLLLLLNEDGDQDGMWSIVHTAEASENGAYLAGFLETLPTLTKTSMWWAATLMMRILNSDAARAELVRQLRGAPASTKNATTLICERINSEDVRFLAKTAPALIAAQE